MSLYASDPNNEYEPTLASDLLAIESALTAPLTADRTVWVDSVAGNDGNDGTQAAPFKTFARAVTDRVRYIVRDCLYTIQLVGAGPYTTGNLVGWGHQGSGRTAVRGDPAWIVHATGSATGDMITVTMPTTAGLGADTHRGRFLKMTSGVCAGCVFLIGENTDTTVTVLDRQSRAVIGAIANGDTFQIVTPRTTLGSTGLFGIGDPSGNFEPPLVLENLILSGYPFVAAALFLGVRAGTCYSNGKLFTRVSSSVFLGLPVRAYSGMGLSAETFMTDGPAHFSGALYTTVSFNVNYGADVILYGCRAEGTTSIKPGGFVTLAENGDRHSIRFDKTLTVIGGAVICSENVFSQPFAKFAVTTGDCLKITHGGQVKMRWAWSGGTADLAGYAINVSSGGQFFTTVAPTLTGGTAGKDLKTTNNGGVANSTLSATGTAAGTAADALLGEVLCRVA